LGFAVMVVGLSPAKGVLARRIPVFEYKGPQLSESLKLKILLSVSVLLIGSLAGFLFLSPQNDPMILHQEGMNYFDKGQYAKAEAMFSKILEKHPTAPIADSANYFYAISYFKEGQYQKTIDAFEQLIRLYPESLLVPEAYYHIGLSQGYLDHPDQAKTTYQFVIKSFPTTNWAREAKNRLGEMSGPGFIFKQAMADFDRQRWVEAQAGFLKIINDYPKAIEADNAAYFYAICSFKQAAYTRTIEEFQRLIKNYPNSPLIPEAYYHIALSYRLMNNVEEAKKRYQFVVKTFTTSVWAKHAQERLKELGVQ
jgi:tol-pal system protein YbgF